MQQVLVPTTLKWEFSNEFDDVHDVNDVHGSNGFAKRILRKCIIKSKFEEVIVLY